MPEGTKDQLRSLRTKLAALEREPLLPKGTHTTCQLCKAPMVTTNNLKKTLPTPSGTVVITRLPGAQCTKCDAVAYDAAALQIIAEHADSEILADYQTSVTRASGKTLGTYFKADLARVLALTGTESLHWKVMDRNNVLVHVERGAKVKKRRRVEAAPPK